MTWDGAGDAASLDALLSALFGRNESLKSFHLDGYQEPPQGWGDLMKGLQGKSSLQSMKWNRCNLGGAGGEALGELLEQYGTLQVLHVTGFCLLNK